MRALPLTLLALIACRNKDLPLDSEVVGGDDTGTFVDADGDGFGAAEDCDDSDAGINPDSVELCDGLDNNCDGQVDEGAQSTFYADNDGDGYGDEGATVEACEAGEGYVEQAGDCDDSDPAYNPAADESDCADPNDYNCDGSVGYADEDGDGYPACEECDDRDAAVNPGAQEVCNDVDDDCDGLTDDADDSLDAGTGATWYADADSDGYGDAGSATQACEQPSGSVADDTDCDDGNGAVNPGAQEICDGLDDDCDGLTDDADDSLDASTGSTWYVDGDGDSYGDANSSSQACVQPSGSVSDDTDCDDADAAVNPGASEVCNDLDDDCDGLVDDDDSSLDASTGSTWYADSDGDSYGDAASSSRACDPPSGSVSDATDCDDSDAAVNPAATEVCNSVDDDCDGGVDVDPADGDTYYPDADCDGYGDPTSPVIVCDQPSGYVSDDSDCDDAEPRAFPGADELCNSGDNDCDGTADNDCESPIEVNAPSHASVDNPSYPGACALIGETSASLNPHDRTNLASYMAVLDGSSTAFTLAGSVEQDVSELDYSIRHGSNYSLPSPGFFSSTNAWPALTSLGSYGASRFRGYINIGCGEPLNYTIGLIGNDALELDIEGSTIMGVNWIDGQWVKFRYVSFPEPGLYSFEVRWSTNLSSTIDPFELVWVEGFEPGYDNYDTFCASSSCGSASTLTAIFSVVDDSRLVQATDGAQTSCAQCASDADCSSSETCNSAGICE
ncbi:MAG: putative metal-binding motif-containing protein [Alphaproteobacteria bacterium]|nr:putative metal-binding motif-containing protein [Alphaproteobacteria bacterium]